MFNMKFSRLTLLSFATATVFFAAQASALTVDNTSMGNAGDSSKFSDPDDQSPLNLGSSANLQGGTPSGSTDPSSIRYDYDPASGSYTPHKE
jgi:hypothetical protein